MMNASLKKKHLFICRLMRRFRLKKMIAAFKLPGKDGRNFQIYNVKNETELKGKSMNNFQLNEIFNRGVINFKVVLKRRSFWKHCFS